MNLSEVEEKTALASSVARKHTQQQQQQHAFTPLLVSGLLMIV